MVAEGAQQQYANWYYQHQQHQQQQYFAETSCATAEPPPPMNLWPAYGQAAYLQYQSHHAMAYQQQQMQLSVAAQSQQQQPIGWGSEEANNNKSHDNNGVFNSEPSSAGTSSGSEIGSPGTPASPIEQTRSLSARSPYEWMKKNTYEPSPGKTRTKDKYRVVYSEHQRLELEKEFYSSKYITTVRKAELAAAVALSERQIKIWFQNRRAKERRKSEKRGDLEPRDIKPIIDAHGIARAPPTSAPPPLVGMANLSLGHTSMSSLASDLQLSSYPTALMTYHHHPRISATITPTTHHPQPPVIGAWADSGVAM